MNGKGPKQKVLSRLLKLDLSHYSVIEIQIGPDSRGPARCLQCQQEFQPGEVWRRMRAPADAEFGSYAVGVHGKCPVRLAAG